jgi:hypothetical protein
MILGFDMTQALLGLESFGAHGTQEILLGHWLDLLQRSSLHGLTDFGQQILSGFHLHMAQTLLLGFSFVEEGFEWVGFTLFGHGHGGTKRLGWKETVFIFGRSLRCSGFM